MAVIGTVVTFAIMFPLRGFLLGQLFWDRGAIPYYLTFVFFWAMAILLLKWLHLKRQKESMLLDVLPTEISEEINQKSLDKFVRHIKELPGSSSKSFLINRVMRGIEHFRVRKSAAETVTMMESQSAIDANNVAGSYSHVKVFLWSLPILGFIGTVLGLSVAVASLATSLAAASDMGALKGAMNSVFDGLGTAFDTTLLALVMSIIVKIPTSALQKSEEDLISTVDEYCNENFLRRLNDGRDGGAERGASGGSSSAFREAVEAAMQVHHGELEKWLSKLDSLGGKMTTQMAENWEKVAVRFQKQQRDYAAQLYEQQVEQQQQLQAQLQVQQEEQQAQLHAQLHHMAEAAAGIQSVLSTVADQTGKMQTDVNGSFGAAQTILQERFKGLEQGLGSLNNVLVKLGEQSIVIQQVPENGAPAKGKKKGWFGSRRW
ncbi:MAG TPA: MotA/TolQ/ExbB proton channel family protein [Planctomicrobium sp.]|nr:MotA/TolQ/ExbB proton channel family protein [Planctomicrobium sp.]